MNQALTLSRFWFWHNLYWLGYLLVKYTHLALLVPLQDEPAFPYLAVYSLLTLINLAVTGWLGARELAIPLAPWPQLRRLCRWLLPLLLVLVPLRQYLVTEFASKSGDSMMTHWALYFVVAIPLVLLPLCGWVAVFLLMKLNFFTLQQLESRQQLLKQARQARLKVLRYQLNPHFMFNTLNALNALIVSRKGLAAEELIQQLSAFLRHSLKNQDEQWLPLQQELDALQAYLAIQQVRFGERLVIHWQLPAMTTLAGVQLPPQLLQPLAENAILYTVAEQSGRIDLHISLEQQGERLSLCLHSHRLSGGHRDAGHRDAGQSAPHWPPAPLPASLAQLQERLELLFGERACLTLQGRQPGFYARLELPMELNYAANPPGDR